MNEAEWWTCNNPKEMLLFLADRRAVSERQYRLFACACFRRVWHALTDPRARKAVGVLERYADDAEREEALAQAVRVGRWGPRPPGGRSWPSHGRGRFWRSLPPDRLRGRDGQTKADDCR